MAEKLLLSSAYFPPVHYISMIHRAGEVCIEKEENYLKQTYRNRCIVLSANGPTPLSIPVLSGTSHKTPVKDIRIDYSKRWQQVHLRALVSSYRTSAFFEFYFEEIEKVVKEKPEYLLELNMNSLKTILKLAGISKPIVLSRGFEPVEGKCYDFRYLISPKKETPGTIPLKEYYQVFSYKFGFVPGLSILDLLFNAGPDTVNYL